MWDLKSSRWAETDCQVPGGQQRMKAHRHASLHTLTTSAGTSPVASSGRQEPPLGLRADRLQGRSRASSAIPVNGGSGSVRGSRESPQPRPPPSASSRCRHLLRASCPAEPGVPRSTPQTRRRHSGALGGRGRTVAWTEGDAQVLGRDCWTDKRLRRGGDDGGESKA